MINSQSVLATNIQNSSGSSLVTLTPTGPAVDNYSVIIDPLPLSGAPSTAINPWSTVTFGYNINYTISVRAVNCIGSGSAATASIYLGECAHARALATTQNFFLLELCAMPQLISTFSTMLTA